MFVSKSYFLLSFVYNLIFGISGTAAVPTSWGDEVKALLTNHNYGDSWVSWLFLKVKANYCVALSFFFFALY